MPSPPDPAAPAPEEPGRLRASPAARRLAHEQRVDLTQVAGTGPDGRVTEDDVRAVIRARVRSQLAPSYPPLGEPPTATTAPAAGVESAGDPSAGRLAAANIDLRRGRHAEAEQAVRAILADNPADAAAHELLGDIRLARADDGGARQAYKEALAHEPGRATAEAKLARATLRQAENQRRQSIGLAYAGADTALIRTGDGDPKKGARWAMFASLLLPGLGQAVNGETTKGVVVAAVFFVSLLLLTFLPDTRNLTEELSLLFVPRRGGQAAPAPGFLPWLLAAILLLDWLYAILDAARLIRPAPSRRDDTGWEP